MRQIKPKYLLRKIDQEINAILADQSTLSLYLNEIKLNNYQPEFLLRDFVLLVSLKQMIIKKDYVLTSLGLPVTHVDHARNYLESNFTVADLQKMIEHIHSLFYR